MEEFTADDLSRFRDIYSRHYGVRLNDEQAEEKADRVIRFVRATLEARQQRLKVYGQPQTEK